MKKKLLFVIPTLDLGGAEKSLVNLLNAIDYSSYEVDLFFFLERGVFLSSIPKEVKIIENTKEYKIFSKSAIFSILLLLIKGKLGLVYHRLLFTFKNRYHKIISVNEQYTWTHTARFLPFLQKEYDAAIGYLEKSTYYFVADNVKAKKKIGWIHTDLEALKLDFTFEKKYFDKLDYLVTVSEGLKERLIHKLPSLESKVVAIENINSKKTILHLAEEEPQVILDKSIFNIIFVGRLVKEKGLFMAIDAIHLLKKNNLNIKFYLVGKGNIESELKAYALEKGVEQEVVFLGMQENPYPLIKQAEVFMMTSFYEGKSIALEEAKILNKAIVITNFSSAKDQIKDNVTGLIAEMNPEAIAEKLSLLYHKNEIRENLKANLSQEKLGNENEVEKLYQLIHS